MSYAIVTDFKYGIDRRRERVAGIPGTLWLGKNVQISRGGDVQRAKKFVSTYSLPANTFGLGQLRGQLFVFGSVAEPTMPVGVKYQRLIAADTTAEMVEVLDLDSYDGAFYVIARYSNGGIHHFYDGERVTDWDTIADAASDHETTAAYLADLIDEDEDVSATALGAVITITARVPGVAFTAGKFTTNLGSISDEDITLETEQANVEEVEEVQATSVCAVVGGTVAGAARVSDITVNGTSLMRSAVTWATSHTATAAAIAVQINNKTGTHGYTAEASGANITITAPPGTGATPNNYAVAATVTGDMLLTAPGMSGGVTAVEPVAQVVTATLSGTEEPEDLFIITIDSRAYKSTGRAAATGTSAFTHRKRMWSPANSLWNYCKLLDATDWTEDDVSSGAGFFNVGDESEGRERLVGAAPYGRQAALFSRNSIHVYTTSTDAEEVVVDTTIGNSGALAARSIIQYGNTDVFYLDEPGVRSLRAHAQSGEAYASDIGNPLDSFLRDYMDTLTEAQIRRAVAVIGPEGRFWLSIGSRVFVLNYFPGSKIAAWTYHEHGFSISDFARVRNKLYARGGNTIYLYGGADGATYPDDDERTDLVSLPFLTAQTPATVKQLTGFDISCTGEWEVRVLINPNDETQYVDAGRFTKTTFNHPHGRTPIPAMTSHVAFDLICSKGGAATISSIAIHYDADQAT